MKAKYKKAKEASTNTFETVVSGVSLFPETLKGQAVNVDVMFTSDVKGETLSFYDSSTKKQIVVPFEPVDALIAHVRSQRIIN